MRKALIPMLASLALCGAATAALIANARAQTNPPRTPMMVAVASPGNLLAQNTPPPGGRDMHIPSSAEMAAHVKQMCQDHYARDVGRMAYLETRLNLSQTEQPLFARWKDVKLGIAKRRSTDCGQRQPHRDHAQRSPVDRMSREEDMLKKRLADLDAERPVLAALYGALTPAQREMLRPRHAMMARGMDHSMGHGMMDRGMMHRSPMEMGDHPPAPPPQ